MSLIQALAEDQYDTLTVEVHGAEIHVKIRRLSSQELALQGTALLYAGIPAPQMAEMMGKAAAAKASGDAAQLVELVGKLPPSALAKQADAVDAKVAAGVVALSEDGETWEPVRMTTNAKSAQSQGVLSVLALPSKAREKIAAAIDAHSGGEGSGQALAAFRRGQSEPDSDSDAGEVLPGASA